MTLETKQKLVLSIIEFLNQSIQNGTIKADDAEGLEVAVQCIGEAFGVDLEDESQVERLSVKPATLENIFDVFLKTRAKVGTSTTPASPPVASGASQRTNPSPEDKAKAQELKQAGNAHMSSKNFDQALDAYTQAIDLDPTNVVYYSNRAATHLNMADYTSAMIDSEKAIELDPSFIKAYSRLGHAHYAIGDFKAAASAFQRGLALDPSNAHLRSGLHDSESALTRDELPSSSGSTPNLGGLEDMLRGTGSGGGGGMPDLASLMNNPMMMQMAQQMMQNGGLESLMSNPTMANMMNRVQSGGGVPSVEEIMSDPALRNLANEFSAAAGNK